MEMDDPFEEYTAFLNEEFRLEGNWEELKDHLDKFYQVKVSEEDGKVVIIGNYHDLAKARQYLASTRVQVASANGHPEVVNKDSRPPKERSDTENRNELEQDGTTTHCATKVEELISDDEDVVGDNSEPLQKYTVVLNPRHVTQRRLDQLAGWNIAVAKDVQHSVPTYVIRGTYERMQTARHFLMEERKRDDSVGGDTEHHSGTSEDVNLNRGVAACNFQSDGATAFLRQSPETEISVLQTDITQLPVDAIVNPVGERVGFGGKLANIIFEKAGKGYRKQVKGLQSKYVLEEGKCYVTGGCRLQAKHVIHVRGPGCDTYSAFKDSISSVKVFDRFVDGHADILKRAITAALKEAEKHGDINSVAFPSIATGKSKIDPRKLIPIMVETILGFRAFSLKKIYLVDLSSDLVDLFRGEVKRQTDSPKTAPSRQPDSDDGSAWWNVVKSLIPGGNDDPGIKSSHAPELFFHP